MNCNYNLQLLDQKPLPAPLAQHDIIFIKHEITEIKSAGMRIHGIPLKQMHSYINLPIFKHAVVSPAMRVMNPMATTNVAEIIQFYTQFNMAIFTDNKKFPYLIS